MANFGAVNRQYIDLDAFDIENNEYAEHTQRYISDALNVKDDLVGALNIDGNTQQKVEIVDRDSKKPVSLNGIELKKPVQITDGTKITHIFAYKDGRLGVVKNGKKSFPIDTEEFNILFKEGMVCDGDNSCRIKDYIQQYQDYMKSRN